MNKEYIERSESINRIRKVASMIGFENPAVAIDCCVSILERVPAVNANTSNKEDKATGYQPRLIDANALWSNIQMLPHNGDIISSEDVEQEIIDAPVISAVPILRNGPLTLEELQKMKNHPVWVKVLDHSVFADPADDFNGWGMVRKSWVRVWDEKRADLVKVDYHFEDYEKEWLAYKMPIRHGHWIKIAEFCGIEVLECSECHVAHPRLRDAFCRDCGAIMDLEVKDK